MATRKMHALVQVHLTTANQNGIRKAYLVSVLGTNTYNKKGQDDGKKIIYFGIRNRRTSGQGL